VTKKWLLEKFIEEEGLEWNDPWIQSLDLEYHNLNPERGLYHDLRRRGIVRGVVDEEQIKEAILKPPADTRARARSTVMRALAGHKSRYVIDWDSIYVEDEKYLNLDDPFLIYEAETEAFIKECGQPSDLGPPESTGGKGKKVP
jgi:proteasome accessory factor A